MELGDIEPAQKHFQKVLEMEAPEELRVLARDGLRKIAARELKARGPRMDAVFYLLDAMRLFWGKVAETIILILAAHLLPQWTTLTRL